MAAKENTLGAPTVGLGQTVTFTAQDNVGIPQLQLPERGVARMGVTGGNVSSSGQARQVQAATPDPTMSALMKLGGKLLEPAIKREQDAKFMEGMQRASEGEAVKEIAEEQPWYSKIFGATSLVDGARAYTAGAKASAIATDLDSRMPDIAKMPGQEFARHVNDLLANNRTGDDATDAIVRQQFMAQMPEVMKKQARSHFLYQQGQLIEANRAYVGTAFKKLATADAMRRNTPDEVGPSAQLPNSATDDGDTLRVELDTLQAMQTPAGMDPKVHRKALSAEVVQSINEGSFAVYNMLEKSGAIGQFEPAEAAQIRGAVNAERARVRSELPAEFAKVLATATEATGQEGATQDTVMKAVDNINKAYAKMTGDPKPYITAQGATSLLQSLYREQQADLEHARRVSNAATTAAEKEAAKMLKINTTKEALFKGAPVNGVESDIKRAAWASLAASQTADVNAVRAKNFNTVKDEDYADALQVNISKAVQGGNGSLMYQAYMQQYAPLIKAAGDLGEAPALAYAGGQAETISAFHRYIKNKPNPTQIDIDIAYSAAITPKAKEPTKTEQAVTAELTTGKLGTLWSMFPGDDIPLKDPVGAARLLTPYVVAGPDLGDAVKAAKANNKDINLFGGYHWRRGTNQADLVEFFNKTHNVAGDQYNRAVKMGVDIVAKENGLDSISHVLQIPNTNDGKPQFAVMGAAPNGDPAWALLSAQRIEDLWITRDKTKAKEVPMPDTRNVGKSAIDLANERFRKEQTK